MKTGGPAFSVPGHTYPDGSTEPPIEGMALRDYFAAHAPEPWPSFQPTMPPRPEKKPEPFRNDGARLSEHEARFRRDWYLDPCWDIDDRYPQFTDWADACRAFWQARDRWANDRDTQRRIQWPYFYADLMLVARDRPRVEVEEIPEF